MAKRSRNIYNLVFKRNIPVKRETYIFNSTMLQVLAKMDGKKTVAAIAADLNMMVEDLLNTFFSLYQQNLILIVPPPPASKHRPISKQKGPNSVSTKVPGKNKPPLNQRQRPNSIKKTAVTNPLESYGPHVTNHHSNINNPSKSKPSNIFSAPDFISNDHDTIAIPNKALKFKFSTPDTKIKKSNADIFSINRLGQTKSQRPVNGILRSEKPKNIPPGDRETIHSEINGNHYKSENNAIEHFEKGLALLQRRDYESALGQFERSLEIDPQNRLCRANIQRIQKLLAEKDGGSKVTAQ